jgi:hypothetical protein
LDGLEEDDGIHLDGLEEELGQDMLKEEEKNKMRGMSDKQKKWLPVSYA